MHPTRVDVEHACTCRAASRCAPRSCSGRQRPCRVQRRDPARPASAILRRYGMIEAVATAAPSSVVGAWATGGHTKTGRLVWLGDVDYIRLCAICERCDKAKICLVDSAVAFPHETTTSHTAVACTSRCPMEARTTGVRRHKRVRNALRLIKSGPRPGYRHGTRTGYN